MSSSRFAYQARPAEAWQKAAEQTGGSFLSFLKDTVTTYAVQKKDNCIRICPPTWANPGHYGLPIFVHYGVGPQNAAVLCELKMFNQRCHVCEAFTIADNAGKEDDAYELKAKKRVLIWLADRNNSDSLPSAWAMPWTVDRDISKLCRDRQTGELYQIDHPDVGYDVMFDREGEPGKGKVEYTGFVIARKPSELEQKHLDFVVANPLPGILLRRSYEEVRDLFEGGAQPANDNQTQQQPPAAPPWEQPVQQPPQFAPQPVNLGVQAPVPQAPPPPVQVAPPPPPVQLAPQLCIAVISYQGNRWGCDLAAHPETTAHNFTKNLGPETPPPTQAPPPVAQQVNGAAQPGPIVEQRPVSSTPRTQSLRDRFNKPA